MLEVINNQNGASMSANEERDIKNVISDKWPRYKLEI